MLNPAFIAGFAAIMLFTPLCIRRIETPIEVL